MAIESPPPAPPPPPLAQSTTTTQKQLKLSSKVSPFIRKLQAAPEPPEVDASVPLPGVYFFYGTLADPTLLAEILSLDKIPELEQAKVIGYSVKLWGQYPALVDEETGHEVHGFAWEVQTLRQAIRLAEYETRNYRSTPCLIFPPGTEDENERGVSGFTFKFCGNKMDLSEGKFDLEIWLKRMGRLQDRVRVECRGK